MFLRHLHLFFVILALILLTAIASAQTPPPQVAPPSRQWQRIAALPPGTQLLVREQDNPVQQPCTLAWIDNTSLACDVFVPDAGVWTVVYPAASVTSVVQRPSQIDRGERMHVRALLVGLGCGALAGGLLAMNAGTRTGFAGAALGSLAGGGLALAATSSFGPPAPLQWSLRIPLRAARVP